MMVFVCWIWSMKYAGSVDIIGYWIEKLFDSDQYGFLKRW